MRWRAPVALALAALAVGPGAAYALRTWQAGQPLEVTAVDLPRAFTQAKPPEVSWGSGSGTPPGPDPGSTPVGGARRLTATPGAPPGLVPLLAGSLVKAPSQAPSLPGETAQPRAAVALTDGAARTVWRVTGDATGTEIAVRLARTRTIRAVGLDPGYDAPAPRSMTPSDRSAAGADAEDGWTSFRPVLEATFTFPDGVAYTVVLDPDVPARERRQTVVLAAPETVDAFTVRIDAVGQAPFDGHDLTAVSDLLVLGEL